MRCLYVSHTGDIDALCRFESICSQTHTLFFPALFVDGLGIVGPTAWPRGASRVIPHWDAAWRRMHSSIFHRDKEPQDVSPSTAALLANVLVFELFKTLTGIDKAPSDRFYTLNPETLQGTWHDFIPGIPVINPTEVPLIDALHGRLTVDSAQSNLADLLSWFARLTDEVSGIFHVWDEGDLSQIPLAQCRVQPIDPLSPGPAELLPETVCTGLSHEDARREAGMVGIEQYANRLALKAISSEHFLGIGAGETIAEGIGRALDQCLVDVLKKEVESGPPAITRLKLGKVKDEPCAFYLQALRSVGVEPVLGYSQGHFGFPVVWIAIDGGFIGSTALDMTMALRHVLAYALLRESEAEVGDTVNDSRWLVTVSAPNLTDGASTTIDVEAWPGFERHQVLAAVETITSSGADISVFDLAIEPFLTEMLVGVFGVSIGEGGSR